MSRALPLAGFALLLLVGGLASLPDPEPSPLPPSSDAVVLELFTSQGCSSCPPADHLLSRLGREGRLQGRVIPLAYHVDYWDRLGWRDPFSSARWSERQAAYAEAFRDGRLYTPQLVVSGRRALVGSDERAARAAIDDALAEPAAATVRLALAPAPDDVGPWQLDIAAAIGVQTEAESLDVMVAVFENGLTTDVRHGENARRTLTNDYVVRRLDRAFALPVGPDVRREERVTIDPPAAWDRERLGVAVFLQDPVSMHIYGAGVAYFGGR